MGKMRVHPDWAPEGAKRFQDMIADKTLDTARFFRVIPGFLAQFGIPGDPAKAATWRSNPIQDDPVKKSNTRGMVSFATSGANSRTTQMFISYGDNARLDGMGFSPFAEVLDDGMSVVDKIQSRHMEEPNQGLIQQQGNTYLSKSYPDLSYIDSVLQVDAASAPAPLEARVTGDQL